MYRSGDWVNGEENGFRQERGDSKGLPIIFTPFCVFKIMFAFTNTLFAFVKPLLCEQTPLLRF